MTSLAAWATFAGTRLRAGLMARRTPREVSVAAIDANKNVISRRAV